MIDVINLLAVETGQLHWARLANTNSLSFIQNLAFWGVESKKFQFVIIYLESVHNYLFRDRVVSSSRKDIIFLELLKVANLSHIIILNSHVKRNKERKMLHLLFQYDLMEWEDIFCHFIHFKLVFNDFCMLWPSNFHERTWTQWLVFLSLRLQFS